MLHFTTQHLHLVATCANCHAWKRPNELIRCISQTLLTCFAIVAVKVLWKVQTLELFLENVDIFGIYFSSPC